MQYALRVFETEDHHDFRTVEIDGAPWFILADVCRALGLQSKDGYFGHHAERLDDDERCLVPGSVVEKANPTSVREGKRGAPSLTAINESGLYALIIGSRLPNAKRFRKWVTSEVLPAIRKSGVYALRPTIPAFIARYNANWDRLTPGYFSVISELAIRLWGRLEKEGHIMADFAEDGTENRPDVSVGRMFSGWLKTKHPNIADNFSLYYHLTDAGEFPAREYPMGMLPLYIEFVDTVWIPQHAARYFKDRDPKALPYLPQLLPSARRSKPALPGRPGQQARPRFMPKPTPPSVTRT